MKYTIGWPGMTVHRTGCRDIGHDAEQVEYTEEIEADSLAGALEAALDDELRGMGWTVEHFEVNPCARDKK